jgi:hypothetical protein
VQEAKRQPHSRWQLRATEVGTAPRAVENRVLRRVDEPKRGEVIGGWRKLRNEKLQNLYSTKKILLR